MEVCSSVCEDKLMADGRIRTVQPNLINLNTAYIKYIQKKIYRGCEKVWKWSWDFPSHLQTRRNKKVNHLITNYIWELIDGSIADLLSMSW